MKFDSKSIKKTQIAQDNKSISAIPYYICMSVLYLHYKLTK